MLAHISDFVELVFPCVKLCCLGFPCVSVEFRSQCPCVCSCIPPVGGSGGGGLKGSASLATLSTSGGLAGSTLRSPSPSFPKPVTTLAVSHSALSAADRERDREHGSVLALSGSASLPSLSLSGSTKPRRTSLTALRAEDDLSEDEDEAMVRVWRLLLGAIWRSHAWLGYSRAVFACVWGPQL